MGSMTSLFSIVAVVVGSQLLFAVARRLGLVRKLEMPAPLMGALFGFIATLFAILVAFSVSIVWATHEEAELNVSREAGALANIHQLSRSFPIATRRQIHVAVEVYAKMVITDEWLAMQERTHSERTAALLTELWQVFSQLDDHYHGHAAYSESLVRLNEVSESRRLRLLKSQDGIPRLMWVLLATVGGILILWSFQFDIRQARGHAIVVGLISLLVSLPLLLVGVLENPYSGLAALPADAFHDTLANLQNLDL